MQNKAGPLGRARPPSNFAAAAAGAKWSTAPGFYLLLLDQPGASAWPITGATFILMHTQADQRRRPATTCWPSSTGPTRTATRAAVALDYVPLPDAGEGPDPQVLERRSSGPNGKPVYPLS